jgi:DNA-binding XRE family transcriptional regulator
MKMNRTPIHVRPEVDREAALKVATKWAFGLVMAKDDPRRLNEAMRELLAGICRLYPTGDAVNSRIVTAMIDHIQQDLADQKEYSPADLRSLREQLGLTQKDVADQVGVTPSTISIAENGGNVATKHILNIVAVLKEEAADRS